MWNNIFGFHWVFILCIINCDAQDINVKIKYDIQNPYADSLAFNPFTRALEIVFDCKDSFIVEKKIVNNRIDDIKRTSIDSKNQFFINYQKSSWINRWFVHSEMFDKSSETEYQYKQKGQALYLTRYHLGSKSEAIEIINDKNEIIYKRKTKDLYLIDKYEKIIWNDFLILVPVYSVFKSRRKPIDQIRFSTRKNRFKKSTKFFKKKLYSFRFSGDINSLDKKAVIKYNVDNQKHTLQYSINLKIKQDTIFASAEKGDSLLQNILSTINGRTLFEKRVNYFKIDTVFSDLYFQEYILTKKNKNSAYLFPIILDLKLVNDVDDIKNEWYFFDLKHSLEDKNDFILRRFGMDKISYY